MTKVFEGVTITDGGGQVLTCKDCLRVVNKLGRTPALKVEIIQSNLENHLLTAAHLTPAQFYAQLGYDPKQVYAGEVDIPPVTERVKILTGLVS